MPYEPTHKKNLEVNLWIDGWMDGSNFVGL